jgi:uncharacterized membrane protein YdjX (TVP38/TMEM64 family)
MKLTKNRKLILKDLGIVIISIAIAAFLVQTDILVKILTSSTEWEAAGSFLAGLFFTSVFTTAPAIVTLGEIGQVYPVWKVALIGAVGAVAGDLILFRFVKDRVSKHILDLLRQQGATVRVRSLIRNRIFRYLTFMLGGMIIASPLPDELGISLLGFSRMKKSSFIVLSFVFNFIGILIIAAAARSIVE